MTQRKWKKNRNLPIKSDDELCRAWANVSRHCESSVELGRRWLSALRQDGNLEDDESEHVHGGLPAWIVPITALYEDNCPGLQKWVERTIALNKWWTSSISSHPDLPQDSKPTPDIVQSFDRDYWKEVNSDVVGSLHVALSVDWKGAPFNPIYHVSQVCLLIFFTPDTFVSDLQYSVIRYSQVVKNPSLAQSPDEDLSIKARKWQVRKRTVCVSRFPHSPNHF